MELSARDQLTGTITDVQLGNVMAEVTVDVGGQELVSSSPSQCRNMGLKRATRSSS